MELRMGEIVGILNLNKLIYEPKSINCKANKLLTGPMTMLFSTEKYLKKKIIQIMFRPMYPGSDDCVVAG